MNCLLIYPEFPDTFWSFKHALAFIGKRASLPPLGLLTVAAMLPREWSLRLVDTNVRTLSDKDLAWADCALISAMVVQRESARRIVARCKASGLRVVAGGPLFDGDYEAFEDVDHFVLNEAELTLGPFLKDWAEGHPQRLYISEGFPDLQDTPVPMWELLELKQYASMSIQFSRGCPFDCEFCNITARLGRRARIKSSRQVLAELDSLYARGWRGNVFFVDDNFIGKRSFLKRDLLPALVAWRKGKVGNTFFTEASINLADDQPLMDQMVEAGFSRVFIGIETPNESSLAECGKMQNRDRDLIADVKRIQRSGLEVQGGFIVGFDHDDASIFQRQIEFIQKSGIVTAMVGLLQALPNTRLLERMRSGGRLRGQSTGDNVDGTTNIIPRMGLDALLDGYRNILEQIYEPEHYYQRIRTFLREYKPRPVRARLSASLVLALIRSVYRLGIVGEKRLAYWKLMLWTQFTRPRLIPEAVTLSIYGYHFRQVCKLHVLRGRRGSSRI